MSYYMPGTTYTEGRAWEVSMPLKKNTAKQYDRILRALGHETRELEEIKGGWIVKWRPRSKMRATYN